MASSVAIFWDYENCALPALEPSFAVVNKIRRLALRYGSVKTFRAYLEHPDQPSIKSAAQHSELQSCGVSLVNCPHNGRKDVADKMIMVDMMAHAIDTPAPVTIILISGDRDFVYAVSILALRQYRIVLLAPRGAHSSLRAQADAVYSWPEDFLPELPPPIIAASAPYDVPNPVSLPRQVSSKTFPTTLEDSWNMKGKHATSLSTAALSPEEAAHGPNAPDTAVKDGVPHATRQTGFQHDQDAASASEVTAGGSEYSGNQYRDVGASPDAEPNVSSSLSDPMERSPVTVGSSGSDVQPGNLCSPSPPNVRNWASLARLAQPLGSARLPSPISHMYTTPDTANVPSSFTLFPAPPFTPPPPARAADTDDGPEWQTYTHSRAAKKKPLAVPPEFKPLVRVLKRQLAAGVVRVESSQLGQFLSQEVQRLGVVYERAGVARLKEYTALAAEKEIVLLGREGADGHNYVSLHPAYRRKAVEHVWA